MKHPVSTSATQIKALLCESGRKVEWEKLGSPYLAARTA